MSLDKAHAELIEALTSLKTTVQAHTDALNALKGSTKVPATAAVAADATPARRGRRSRAEIEAEEKAAAEAKAAAASPDDVKTEAEIREEFGDFLAFGNDKNKDDLAERDRRTAFVISLCDHFEVEGVKDIPEEDRQVALNWMNRYQLGETTIDFENDDGAAESEKATVRPAAAAAKKRSLV